MSPLRRSLNPNVLKPLTANPPSGCTAGCTGEQSEGGIADADLAALVAVWPTLSEPIKAAIRALVGASR